MAKTDFFIGPVPRVFAHRGLHSHRTGIDENSLEAFAQAIEFGATHIESDVHATKDGVAVLFHDDTLDRVSSISSAISELTLSQIKEIRLSNDSEIPTLEEAFVAFPDIKLNLDIKSKAAIMPTVSAILAQNATRRVLVSSFSNSRRQRALALLGYQVATSASSKQVIAAWASHNLLFGMFFKRIVRNIDAFQIPVKQGPVRFDSSRFIARANRNGVEVHFWTINNPIQMKRLIELGAHGIVTDRVDLFHRS